MQRIVEVAKMINRFLALLAGVTVAVFTGIILYDVALRYVLAKPLAWSIDVGELSMLLLTYLPAAILSQEGGHVSVEILVGRLSGRKKQGFEMFSSLAGLCFAVLLEWQALVTLGDSYQRGTLTMIGRLPVYPAVAFFAVGAFFLIIQQLLNLLLAIDAVRAGEGEQER